MNDVFDPSRREFLQTGAAASGAFIVGCSGDGGASDSPLDASADAGHDTSAPDAGANPSDDLGIPGDDGVSDEGAPPPDEGPDVEVEPDIEEPPPEVCEDPFAGGKLLATLPFAGEPNPQMNTAFNAGLDGRLYTDLTAIDQDNLTIPVENFYIRTRWPDQIDESEPWSIAVTGMVTQELTLTMADLEPLIEPMGHYLLECSGNGGGAHFGLLSACEWSGVPLQKVLDLMEIEPASTHVLFNGFDGHSKPSNNNHSTPGASWVFTFEQLLEYGAFLGTHMNGEPLVKDHGKPIRLYVPRWYGCCSVKWLDEIRLTDDSEPATSQMKEFAQRTHQIGTPQMAKDYKPATQDQAAMPTRLELWDVDGTLTYRVLGIMWGGYELTEALEIRFGNLEHVPVDVCPTQKTNDSWTVWEHRFDPPAKGIYEIQCRISDPTIPTLRLDIGFYNRAINVTELGDA